MTGNTLNGLKKQAGHSTPDRVLVTQQRASMLIATATCRSPRRPMRTSMGRPASIYKDDGRPS
jgi:hypothetical protein